MGSDSKKRGGGLNGEAPNKALPYTWFIVKSNHDQKNKFEIVKSPEPQIIMQANTQMG